MPPAPIAPEWQQPYVDVFKLCDVDNLKEFEVLGDVTPHMDRIIGKKVFKVRGIIPAANYVRVPKLKSQNLGLTGRFLYMQLKVSPVKVFVIHVEAMTTDQIVHRISISTMYKDEQLRRKSSGIQIPFPRASHRWCIVALDLAGALQKFTRAPFHSLRSVQLCSWLTVRSMYTSEHKFSLQTLPRDMALSHALDSSAFEYIWLPREPMDVEIADIMPVPRRIMDKVPLPSGSQGPAGMDQLHRQHRRTSVASSADEPQPKWAAPPPHTPTTIVPPVPPVFQASVNAQQISKAAHELAVDMAHRAAWVPDSGGPTATAAAVAVYEASKPQPPGPTAAHKHVSPRPVHDAQKGASNESMADLHGAVLEPDPALTLVRVNAYTGEFVRTLVWPPHSEELVFTAGSVVVAMRADTGVQRFFLGHTAHVVAIAFDAEGAVMATAQEGKQAVIRLWDFKRGTCVAILNGHASGLVALDVSADARALVAVGQDAASRQLMVLWDISGLRHGDKAEIVAKSTTEHNIKAIKFSAYEEDHFVTCGRDNVRIYRLKQRQLRGVTVRLATPDQRVTTYAGGITAALGPNVFTDIAFESSVGVYAPETRHVFVSSASGAVFEIDYASRALLCVYQLHSAAINSLCIHDGFCVTGSDDKQLRVWPMDFSDYLLEAEHEAAVTGLGVSPDGLRIAIGTENGALGVLDVPSHNYVTLLRSHTATVNMVVADPNRDQYCTVSSDGTIRIWDLHTHQQLVEFDAPGETVVCAAYHPKHYELACGFANGRLRVFDVATTTLVQEHQQHRAALVQLAYSPDGTKLFTGGADGGLCVYDVVQIYQPVKFLSAGVRDIKVCLAVSPDGRYLATVARDPYRSITSILLFHCTTLEPYMRIETDTPVFKQLLFSPDGMELWAVAEPNRLDRYELFEGQLLQQVSSAHRLDVSALAVDPRGRFVATGSLDALVKLWGVVPRSAPRRLLQDAVPPHQAFSGHSSAVSGLAVKGDRLVSVGDAESIYVWRINAPQPRKPKPAPKPKGQAAAANAAAAVAAAGGATLVGALPAPVSATVSAGASPAGWLQGMPGAVASIGQAGAPASGGLGPASADPLGLSATLKQWSLGEPVGHGTASLHTSAGAGVGLHAAAAAAASPRTEGPPSPGKASTAGPPSPRGKAARKAKGKTDVEVGDSAVLLPTAPPGPPEVATATSLTVPADRPACHAVTAYTPSATAQTVVWVPVTGLFAYTVDHVVVVEDLATHAQRYLAHLTQPVSTIAVSADSRFMAAGGSAAEPSGFAEIAVWDVPTGVHVCTFHYHAVAVEALSFSPCGRYLVSVGRDPERALVLWDLSKVVPGEVEQPQCLVAVGRTRYCTSSVAWSPPEPAAAVSLEATLGSPAVQDVAQPQYCSRFVTAGGDGVLLWTLKPSYLEQTPVMLEASEEATASPSHSERASIRAASHQAQPTALAPRVAATAVTVDAQGVVIAADEKGGIWELVVREAAPGAGSLAVAMRRVADVGGSEVTRVVANDEAVALGTVGGLVTTFSRNPTGGAWARGPELHLDGAVNSLTFEPHMQEAVVATSSATVWYINCNEGWRVPLVSGHTAAITYLAPGPIPPGLIGLQAMPGSSGSLPGSPRSPRGLNTLLGMETATTRSTQGDALIASCTADGVLRVWQTAGPQTEPVVEFQSPVACTCAAFVGSWVSSRSKSPSPSPLPSPRRQRSQTGPAPWDSPRSGMPSPRGGGSRGTRVLGGYADGSLRLFAVRGAAAGGAALKWASNRHQAPVVAVAIHPRRPLALTASSEGALAVTDLETSRLVVYLEHFIPGSQQQLLQLPDVDAVTVAEAGLAAAAVAADGSAGDGAGAAAKPSNPLCAIDTSAADATVCAAAWKTHFVVFATPWDTTSLRMLALYKCEPSQGMLSRDVPAAVRFVPNTTKIVAYSSPLLLGKVLMFDYRLAAVVASVAVPQMVRSLALSPDGKHIALGGTGGSVFVAVLPEEAAGSTEPPPVTKPGQPAAPPKKKRAPKPVQLAELAGHLYPVTSLLFSPDGHPKVVSAGGSTILSWSVGHLLVPDPPPPPEPRVL